MSKILISVLFLSFFISLFGCSKMREYGTRARRSTITPIEFNKKEWFEGDRFDNPKQPAMARWLISNQILVGKSKKEVIEMLGEGHEYPEIERTTIYTLEDFVDHLHDNWLGAESLHVVFDEQNKVTNARIIVRFKS